MLLLRYKSKEINFPELNDINFEQFLALQKIESDLEAFKILNCGVEKLDGSEDSLKLMESAVIYLDELIKDIQAFVEKPYAVELKILGKVINQPKDIGHLSFGASRQVKAIIKSMGDEAFLSYKDYPALVGHYVYEQVCKTGDYSEYKAEEFVNEVILKEVDFRIVLLLGDFFLLRHVNYWKSKRESLRMKALVWSKKQIQRFSISSTILT